MDGTRELRFSDDKRWISASYIFVALAVLAFIASQLVSREAFDPFYACGGLIVPLLPVAAAWRVWQRRGTPQGRPGWGLIAIGLGGYLAYELLWFVDWLVESPLAVRIADIVNLVFAPFVLLGVLKGTAKPDTDLHRRRQYLDAAIIAISIASVIQMIISFEGGGLRGLNSGQDAVLILQPLIDLVTLAGIALLWTRMDRGRLPGWAIAMSVSLMFGLLADLWFAFPSSVGRDSPWFVIAAWFGTWSSLAVGTTSALRADTARAPTNMALSKVPYIFAGACFLVLILAVMVNNRVVIITSTIASIAVTCLVLARQYLTVRDVTSNEVDRTRAEADARLAALVRHGSDMLSIVNTELVITYASPSHQWIVGAPPEAIVGLSIVTNVHRDDLPLAQRCFERLLHGDSQRESMVVRLRDAEKRWRWLEVIASNLLAEPSINGIVCTSHDITNRKELEEQLADQALRDPLTGLGNRRLFRDRVAHAIHRLQRAPSSVAVLLLDLDHFKFVNDTLGHAKGDALLIAVADRVRQVVRASDTVARLGGDEFAVLLEDLTSASEADATASRILESLGRAFKLDEREVFVQTSIGIAIAGDGQGVDALVTDADVAMYAAKAAGRNRAERFTSAMRAEIEERHDVAAALHGALERDEFDLLYQPLVSFASGRVVGAEALIRWRHRELGVLLPARFIHVAEESDLIVHIGRAMLKLAARDAAYFRRATTDSATLRIGVNLSARQLLSLSLVADVQSALTDADVRGDALAVELTETILASHDTAIVERLQALRELGLLIALDDFGTGYSSLAYLRRYPIDVLKVDRSFVSWNKTPIVSDGVARAIVSIGESLSMRTVAEGVETREQLDQMRQLGCSIGQGYFFSKPLARDDFVQFLRTWEPQTILSGGSAENGERAV
jgi:diguanylate cyclase (GGDEF)-like protein/PAS domain S-box-containing protein